MDAMVLRAAMCGRTMPERTVKSCGPDAPVLASSLKGSQRFPGMTVARKPVTGANSYKP